MVFKESEKTCFALLTSVSESTVNPIDAAILFTDLCRLPGVDIMITIFCDFCQFSAKKWSFRVKNAKFFAIFSAKIFKKS
jgi:hypothetical protein